MGRLSGPAPVRAARKRDLAAENEEDAVESCGCIKELWGGAGELATRDTVRRLGG